MSEKKTKDKEQHEQRFYALFATQNGNECGGDFSLSYRDSKGNLRHTLPWLTPHTEDMKIFKLLTMENVVVMGFKTFESLGHRPLTNRINIVVASRPYNSPGVPTPPWAATQLFFVRTVDGALNLARERFQTRDVFFIGGKKILDEVFVHQANILDGIYHSKIAPDWPKANNNDFNDDTQVASYHIPASVMEDYRLVAERACARVICAFWERSQVPQTDISIAVSFVSNRPSNTFYKPSAHQESMQTHSHANLSAIRSITAFKNGSDLTDPTNPVNVSLAHSANLAKEREVSTENLEALRISLNQHTVDAVTKTPVGTVVRDRSMAIVDPFDLKNIDNQIKDKVKEFIFDELTEKRLVTPVSPPCQISPQTPSAPSSDFVSVATEIGELLVVKDAAYGSAFEKTKEIFKILFPSGLPVSAYDDALTIMRILDKICRLGVLCTNPEENKTSERSEDAWKDIAGYSIKALCEQRRRLAAEEEGDMSK